MMDAPGQPPVVAESLQTHTPLDPHTEALALAQEHNEELRQSWQSQPPPMPMCPGSRPLDVAQHHGWGERSPTVCLG